jgi:hypothetical protein
MRPYNDDVSLIPHDMLILFDLRVLGCLTYGHTGSVSVSRHFFAGVSTVRSPPWCSCQDQGTDAGRPALVEQAVDDCVELASGGVHVVEHDDAAPLCAGKAGHFQDLAEGCRGRRS